MSQLFIKITNRFFLFNPTTVSTGIYEATFFEVLQNKFLNFVVADSLQFRLSRSLIYMKEIIVGDNQKNE